jgi:hypothetical protein
LAFEPSKIPEDQCVQGHLDADPIYDVLLRVHGAKVSGRLTTEDASGPNHLYFMQGRPVGVQLAEYVHPLGQLLLELGRINGQTFVRAQPPSRRATGSQAGVQGSASSTTTRSKVLVIRPARSRALLPARLARVHVLPWHDVADRLQLHAA